jgi:hypothetical protein
VKDDAPVVRKVDAARLAGLPFEEVILSSGGGAASPIVKTPRKRGAMAGYWSNVVRLAVRESFGRVRLDAPVSAALRIGPAAICGAIVWIVSGSVGYGLIAAVVAMALLFGWQFMAIPPRLAKETEDRLAEIQQRLDEISADRPIAYEYLTLGAQRRDGNILLSGVTLVLRNASDRTMAYTFKDVTLHVNEQAIGLKDQEEISGLIGHQQEMGYAVAPQEPVEVPRFSEIIVDFNIEYDNQPPLRKRTMGRRVSCKLESLEPLTATYLILEEREI